MRTVLCELRCFRSIPSSLRTINLKHVQDTEDGRQSFSNLSMCAGIPWQLPVCGTIQSKHMQIGNVASRLCTWEDGEVSHWCEAPTCITMSRRWISR
jgi:hypothetical protein